jgi:hypothetical protein
MFELKKDKLKVSFKDNIGKSRPIMPRKYTLTHSDETAELFLSIGNKYDLDKINYSVRDEVLGSWEKDDEYYLLINIEVGNNNDINSIIKRDEVFRRELPLALTAIVYGDNLFLENNKELYDASVIIKFNCQIKEYDVLEKWGKIKDYKYNESNNRNEFPNYKFNPFPMMPPAPTPGYKNGYNNKKQMDIIIKNALISMLDPYISSEVDIIFGKNTPYCIKKSEILDAKVIRSYGECNEEYEIVVGIRAGRRPPFYNNLIITFSINEKRVKIKSVKNPKN